MNQIELVRREFRELFGTEPEFVVQAPGRVNLIGEHTDYNSGFVFPAAINFEVVIAGTPRTDGQVRIHSLIFNQTSTYSLNHIEHDKDNKWSNYVRAISQVLIQSGYKVSGMNAVVTGNVPLSSGLSSSAAIEVASCLAFEAASGFQIDPVERARFCQRAEREFVGVNCGIMDQFISANGVKDHAIFLDTLLLEYREVPLPSTSVSIVVCDTNKPRGLVDSQYNTRRSECEEAVSIIARFIPGVYSLRDVTLEQLCAYEMELSGTVFRRARHVINENNRVQKSVDLLESANIAGFGKLMNESHDSLQFDYEVSCFELDTMVEAARHIPGVYGSRMTGAGFGGCTVSLVNSDNIEHFKQEVSAVYKAKTGLPATIYVCSAEAGARRII